MPQEVQPPVAKSLPNSLSLSWNLPRKANGIITQYSLYMDGMLIYSGNGNNYTATGKTILDLRKQLWFIVGHTHIQNYRL